ncbi:MAG TPA: hypothetical protein VNA22_06130, partial [Pyrinomonadaceae bacterium]|nr:hypothetical protein [Pyrinomonadaceae bacterium]
TARRLSVVLLTGLLLATTAGAQSKLVSSKEYYEAVDKRPEVDWDERVRRVETTRDEMRDGVVVKSLISVSEVLLPDRQRHYSKLVESGKTTETEEIRITHFLYTRTNGGAWTKFDLRKPGSGSGYGSGGGSGSGRMTCTQYSIEPTVINGTPVNLYQKIVLYTQRNEIVFEEHRKWLTAEGLIYREEQIEGAAYPRMETLRNIVTYDYPTDLKIEAPIP